MWGQKKPDAKSTDAMSPLDATADCATGWLGSSLHVKGDITGTEDLLIDGSVEGLIQLHERKLTVGTTAKVTADINARDVVVYGSVQGNVRAKGTDRDQEGRFGDREFDDGPDYDRRRRGLQGFDRNRQERGEGSCQEPLLAGGGGWRGAEEHLTILHARPCHYCGCTDVRPCRMAPNPHGPDPQMQNPHAEDCRRRHPSAILCLKRETATAGRISARPSPTFSVA
jgi:hypothetical protein